jgi:hypothetical protein
VTLRSVGVGIKLFRGPLRLCNFEICGRWHKIVPRPFVTVDDSKASPANLISVNFGVGMRIVPRPFLDLTSFGVGIAIKSRMLQAPEKLYRAAIRSSLNTA